MVLLCVGGLNGKIKMNMKIIILTKDIKLTQALKDFIENKINDLEKFLEIFHRKYFNEYFGKGKPRSEAWVEIGKSTKHHRKGPFFRAECQIRLPGKHLRAEAEREDLRLAIIEIKDELQRQLKQYKEKVNSKTKRQLRGFKKELHLSPQSRFYRKGRIREEGL